MTVVAAPVEDLIARGVLYRLDTPELAASLASRAEKVEALAGVADELVADRTQLEELSAAYGNRDVTMREWLEAKKPIDARIERAERQISRATNSDVLHGLVGHGAELAQSWDTLNLNRQAGIVAAVLDHAVIAAGMSGARSLDPQRVQPVWKL